MDWYLGKAGGMDGRPGYWRGERHAEGRSSRAQVQAQQPTGATDQNSWCIRPRARLEARLECVRLICVLKLPAGSVLMMQSSRGAPLLSIRAWWVLCRPCSESEQWRRGPWLAWYHSSSALCLLHGRTHGSGGRHSIENIHMHPAWPVYHI